MPHCLARGASTKENTSKATSLAKGRWFHTKNLCSTLYAMEHRSIVPVCKLQGLEDSERLWGWYALGLYPQDYQDFTLSLRLVKIVATSITSWCCGRGHVLRRWVLGRHSLRSLAPFLWPLLFKSLDLQGLKTWNGQVHLARWKVLWWRMAVSNSAPTSNMLWSAVGTSWNHGVMYENLLYDAVGVGSGTAAEFGTWVQAVLFSLRFDITQDDRCTNMCSWNVLPGTKHYLKQNANRLYVQTTTSTTKIQPGREAEAYTTSRGDYRIGYWSEDRPKTQNVMTDGDCDGEGEMTDGDKWYNDLPWLVMVLPGCTSNLVQNLFAAICIQGSCAGNKIHVSRTASTGCCDNEERNETAKLDSLYSTTPVLRTKCWVREEGNVHTSSPQWHRIEGWRYCAKQGGP